MALPLNYSVRNTTVRWASAIFTAVGIAMTVAVFAGVLALRGGFESLYQDRGEEDVAIYLRHGAQSEGESAIPRSQINIVLKERPEVLRDESGRPLAAAECFLAVYMDLVIGGRTNVPLRGIQPMSLELMGDSVRLVEGRWHEWGSDEVVVGLPLTERMVDARPGDTLVLNRTPFKVVGVYEQDGPYAGEVWGDVERMLVALDRPFFQRVVARVQPGTDFEALAAELDSDARTPMKVISEREYLENQTGFLSVTLTILVGILTITMGAAAVLGSMNTMLASVGARTHEIGVLLALGFSRVSIFLSFLLESAFIGLLGGALGLALVLPFDGLQTGMTNFNTFTDVSFAVNLTLPLMLRSVGLAFMLGLIGGALPAFRAARMKPVEALRA